MDQAIKLFEASGAEEDIERVSQKRNELASEKRVYLQMIVSVAQTPGLNKRKIPHISLEPLRNKRFNSVLGSVFYAKHREKGYGRIGISRPLLVSTFLPPPNF